ncbi:hypothetical protein EJB05_38854 [Eragrostis curvula]|uniref:Small ribosomal subunit protein uS17 n=1 Tax=Eragrostis curvula TaxID=38414 RepID=A0A5J9TWW1_9POAL|nr:hypothetical protein EJB05_38854 [Eragrostis curvula]
MAEQTERAFLKQPKVFLCSKKITKGKKPGKGGNRFWKNIGLGFKTPREAIEDHIMMNMNSCLKLPLSTLDLEVDMNIRACTSVGAKEKLRERETNLRQCKGCSHGGTYIDKKCPFTGTVSIRGRIIAGTCHSAKMNRTIIVRRNYLHFVKKYEKRHSNIPAHISPCFRVREGDHVIIGQCRPLSKTVRFNVLKVIPAGSMSGAGKKAFTAA